jgi:hypothetical protein
MATTYRQRFLGIIAQNERDMSAMFADMQQRIEALAYRYADADGVIPPERGREFRRAVEALVMSYFLARSQTGDPAPYEEIASLTVPLAPYARILIGHMQAARTVATEEQSAIVARMLRFAPDVSRVYLPQWQQGIQRAIQYDPLHTWVDERGYTLSTKIWRTGIETRRKLDAYLQEAIAEGKGAREMAKELEPFLQPGRALKRTNKPYGTTASFDAMRLARTEITAAHSHGARMAAEQNPFVVGADWVRSSSRLLCKSGICDALEAGSPYPLDKLPHIPGSSHSHCMCRYRWRFSDDISGIVVQLRANLQAAGMLGTISVTMGNQ